MTNAIHNDFYADIQNEIKECLTEYEAKSLKLIFEVDVDVNFDHNRFIKIDSNHHFQNTCDADHGFFAELEVNDVTDETVNKIIAEFTTLTIENADYDTNGRVSPENILSLTLSCQVLEDNDGAIGERILLADKPF